MILDTHTLLWMDRDDPSLGSGARARIEGAWRAGEVAVFAISFWEVAMLAERGRVKVPMALDRWRGDWLAAGLIEIPVDGRIGVSACALEGFHRDSADRFIVATAQAYDRPLMTADPLILDWPGALVRYSARDYGMGDLRSGI